jgi:hypothetical protein
MGRTIKQERHDYAPLFFLNLWANQGISHRITRPAFCARIFGHIEPILQPSSRPYAHPLMHAYVWLWMDESRAKIPYQKSFRLSSTRQSCPSFMLDIITSHLARYCPVTLSSSHACYLLPLSTRRPTVDCESQRAPSVLVRCGPVHLTSHPA